MRSWKFYRAAAEQYREPNVFLGPLNTEARDVLIHYVRQGKLGDGTDYFGVYAEDHAAWLKVQPKAVGLVEITQDKVPVPNQFTEWQGKKQKMGLVSDDVGLTPTPSVEVAR